MTASSGLGCRVCQYDKAHVDVSRLLLLLATSLACLSRYPVHAATDDRANNTVVVRLLPSFRRTPPQYTRPHTMPPHHGVPWHGNQFADVARRLPPGGYRMTMIVEASEINARLPLVPCHAMSMLYPCLALGLSQQTISWCAHMMTIHQRADSLQPWSWLLLYAKHQDYMYGNQDSRSATDGTV